MKTLSILIGLCLLFAGCKKEQEAKFEQICVIGSHPHFHRIQDSTALLDEKLTRYKIASTTIDKEFDQVEFDIYVEDSNGNIAHLNETNFTKFVETTFYMSSYDNHIHVASTYETIQYPFSSAKIKTIRYSARVRFKDEKKWHDVPEESRTPSQKIAAIWY